MKRNILLTYIFSIIFYFQTDTALWPLFLTNNRGFSLGMLGIFNVIAFTSRFIFDIPSGILSDKIGRVKVLLYSVLTLFLSNLFMLYGTTLIVVCIAYILWGIAMALISGTLEAFLYDSLKSVNRENEYKRINTNLYFMTMISFSIAMTAGGLISYINMEYMYVINMFMLVFAVIACLLMKEPYNTKEYSITVRSIANNSIDALKNNKNLMYLIIFVTLITAVSNDVWNFSQKLLSDHGLSLASVSIEAIVTTIIWGLWAEIGYYFENKLGKVISSIFSAVILIIPLIILGMSNNLVVILFTLTLTGMSSSFISPIFSSYINEEIESSFRSTVLSIQSFIICVISLVIAAILNITGDIGTTFVIIGLLAIPACLFLIVKMLPPISKN